jgi:hypothetical protein
MSASQVSIEFAIGVYRQHGEAYANKDFGQTLYHVTKTGRSMSHFPRYGIEDIANTEPGWEVNNPNKTTAVVRVVRKIKQELAVENAANALSFRVHDERDSIVSPFYSCTQILWGVDESPIAKAVPNGHFNLFFGLRPPT